MTPVSADGGQPQCTLGRFFWIWLLIGVQSFGGGATTLVLIRAAAIDNYGWYTEEEFSRAWALVQVAPGINLLALVILIGQRVRGGLGVISALLGLLLPTATITVAMTSLYARIQHAPTVQAALSGMIPATIGLGLLATAQIALPYLRRQAGRRALSALPWWLLLVAAAVAARAGAPVFPLLALSGLIGAMIYRRPPDAPSTGDSTGVDLDDGRTVQ